MFPISKEEVRKRREGFFFGPHSHACHMTETIMDFEDPGGTLIMPHGEMRPSVTAWRWSHMTSRCHDHLRGVVGSRTCHASRTNPARV
jgi:hypothetical protein